MRHFVKFIIEFLIFSFEDLILFLFRNNDRGDIALIRLDAIGDFIIWLDTAKEYRSLYPNQKITLIANPAWADLARQLPYWDEVFPVDIRHLALKNLTKRWRLLLYIHQRGFHVAIQPMLSRAMAGDTLIRATGAKHRIGSVGDLVNATQKERITTNRWYTQLFPASSSPMMELFRNAEFFNYLAATIHQPCIPQLPHLCMLSADLQPASPYFIVFPGASWVGRQWPVEQFAAVLVALQLRHGWQPVLCGAPNEAALCQAIAHAAAVNCTNLAGRTNLSELVEVVRGARLLIGNETSAVHIAAAVGTPAVCVLGGGHFGRFIPYPDIVGGIKPVVAAEAMPCYHCNWQCNQPHTPNGPVPCISNISVATVLAAAQQALETAGLPQAGVELPFKNLNNLIEASTSIANSEP